ncbi:uncharacterized protein HD556DRAFT_1313600 [Suillus plorans]|uniref:Uncharacterized protein n=1 Tax=Suillus plorans TaxID=116603 RepID=A0A9P7DAJ5_9AGAM|nr:uncharacterized protein HD556DRAFT_1313600 [Suillus plorans]KAG1786247.1 hypothetical protein HD556DRAFT_1313600 [Suillus plorans]
MPPEHAHLQQGYGSDMPFIEIAPLKVSGQLKTQRKKRQEYSKGAYMSNSDDTSSFLHYKPPTLPPNSAQPSFLPQPSYSLPKLPQLPPPPPPPPPKLPLPPSSPLSSPPSSPTPELPSTPSSPPMSLEVLPMPISLPESLEVLLAPSSMPPSPVMHTVTASALVSVSDASRRDYGQVIHNIESEDESVVKEGLEVDAKWDVTHEHLWANWTSCLDD